MKSLRNLIPALVVLFGLISVLPASARHLPGAADSYLGDLLAGDRFSKDSLGVITDSRTGLQWLEGPDRDFSWTEAQTWIQSLGEGWRTPIAAELKMLYIKCSKRRGRVQPPLGGNPNAYDAPLKLDPVFASDANYFVWAERIDERAARYVEFINGKERSFFFVVGGMRAFAVREKR